MFHPLLARQLKKVGVAETQLPTTESWENLLERISRAYTDADQERYLLERSLTISSQEMQEVYERLRQSETRYALAAQGANDGLWDWNLITNEIYFSPRWKEILGYEKQMESDAPLFWLDRIHADDRLKVEAALAAHIEGNTRHFSNEHRVMHSDGHYRWVLSRGLAVRDEQNVAIRLAGSLTDITEHKAAENKLQHDAHHDALTGLPNRAKLMDRLARSLERNKHNNNYIFAVLFIDLDRFKIINDSLGHLAGDKLLHCITKRLIDVTRPDDMVARLGGDEFVVLLDNLKEKQQVASIAARVLTHISEPIDLNGEEVYTTASIGVAFASPVYERAETLLRDADIAMYRAKSAGKARFEIFDPEMHTRAVSLLHLENDLRRAIQRNELLLHYQPIVSLENGEMIGFEALARWHHPQRGTIPPNEFIPVAEDTGLIIPIGEWVLREACRQMRAWEAMYETISPLMISVNLSGRQLEQHDLVEMIEAVLAETEMNPNCLRLEITESIIMQNAEKAIEKIARIRALGIRISIDDFGTGYSSLSYLHRFPIDTLKVDRSFINSINDDTENSEIVRSIIMLAHNLGIEVIAEGVETREQLNYLQEIKCGYGQGYYYSRPVNSHRAADLIKKLLKLHSEADEEDQPDNVLFYPSAAA